MPVDRSRRTLLKYLSVFAVLGQKTAFSHSSNIVNRDIEFVMMKGWILRSTDLQ